MTPMKGAVAELQLLLPLLPDLGKRFLLWRWVLLLLELELAALGFDMY